ncbi:uncharacterized protein LOC133515920 [Cydia pomonella]|uniref:uncharacterized protein LOC133515920 n=1 Tax=Cydia pomonella TaxID=82600 RepID=UPI002ADE4EBA|nr:uncharacterized protein LOC133515920 [Cydia pomonella]
MTMLLASGLSTIILLKYAFSIFQANEESKDVSLLLLVYIFIRCLKYTILVIIPCYYSSKTTTQVSIIRKTLHDALNNDHQCLLRTVFVSDKIDCRRLKAFFQLTRDSEFAYALWGVINLNMSLPLSYISLCTTYLVIIIQFSKFID